MSSKEAMRKVEEVAEGLIRDHCKDGENGRTSPLDMVRIVLAWDANVHDTDLMLECRAGEIEPTNVRGDFTLFASGVEAVGALGPDAWPLKQHLYNLLTVAAERHWCETHADEELTALVA